MFVNIWLSLKNRRINIFLKYFNIACVQEGIRAKDVQFIPVLSRGDFMNLKNSNNNVWIKPAENLDATNQFQDGNMYDIDL